MPRALFNGIAFDFLLDGLQDTHEGMVTVREIPAGPGTAYLDFGGPRLPRRTVTIRVDSEADYLSLAALCGTIYAQGPPTSEAEGFPDGEFRDAVLLSIARTWRKGTGPQLCRTEWLFP
jgi:hypothetical protein